MGRRGDRFSPGPGPGLGRGSRPDRFDHGLKRPSGFYPVGRAQRLGEPVYPSVLERWDKEQGWTSWRSGMTLAFTQLFNSTSQYLPARVLRYGGLVDQGGYTANPALLVAFPSRTSPEGRWTVCVRPRGSDITGEALGEAVQREVFYGVDGSIPLRLLEVDISRTWRPGTKAAASSLIGELVEDSAISASAVLEQDDEALILLCVAAYPEEGRLVFDGSRRWRRVLQANGRRVLREEKVSPRDPLPRFRAERHLCQSLALSCNCPAFLGVEYARLRHGALLGSQALFPARGPESGVSGQVLPPDLATMLLTPPAAPSRGVDGLEGVARRFFRLNWQRLPSAACKHVHAVRFAIGCPIEEPSEYVTLASDYWDGLRGQGTIDELQAPLALDRFVNGLNRTAQLDQAWGELSSTMAAGSIGDAFGVVPGRLEVLAAQTLSTLAPGAEPVVRFNEEWATAEPRAAEEAVAGDVWVGRGTGAVALPYIAAGEVLDEPFYRHDPGAAIPIYP